ncbi:hypothetical protein [Treponema sp. J25]|jgi:hypothetical protein|uniref:hypothetical protein n=1 Tax=Treponema sp. J25 TaxID=2094121 RepID=UPI001048B226|nr:hypothetical protein [Treponema sp. J25]TCW61434.1 hypothetical protein C5O22_06330 [Treponema sp. J25]
MKRFGLIALVVTLSMGTLWANGNQEKLSTLEGTILQITPLQTEARISLQSSNGEIVEVILPLKEIARLQIREQARIRFHGVLVPGDTTAQIQTRLYARTCEINGKQEQVQDAVRLTAQDQERLLLQLKDGTGEQTQTRTQTQMNTATATQTQSVSGKK